MLAVSLPVFSVAARTVTDGWTHPWSHLWIPATLAVALEVRRLLHRYPSYPTTEVHWHLYFLAAGGATAIVAAGAVFNRSPTGLLDPLGVAATAVAGCLVVTKELTHLQASAPRGND